jgi:hypothetical protein
MRASLNFTLPDDDYEVHAALSGQQALRALSDIDHKCRSLIKHGDADSETIDLAETIRNMIPSSLLECGV